MPRKDEGRIDLVTGIAVVAVAAVLGALTFVRCGGTQTRRRNDATIVTDFRSITGLRRGSEVQLSGVPVGEVRALDFLVTHYDCDPRTEDIGRHGEGRTDACDRQLFCAAEGRCAELEPWTSPTYNPPCTTGTDCGVGEICVDRAFRREHRRVGWAGPAGVCSRIETELQRVRVTAAISRVSLPLVRSDSFATVGTAGVLGDKLLNITVGEADPVGEGGRVHAVPSLIEDLELVKDRVEGLTERVETGLAGVARLFGPLEDDTTKDKVRSTFAQVAQQTRAASEGRGLVGGLLADPEYVEDFRESLRGVDAGTRRAQRFLRTANTKLTEAGANVDPAVAKAHAFAGKLAKSIAEFKDPTHEGKLERLLFDREGKLLENAEKNLAELHQLLAAANRGEGKLGPWVGEDDRVHDQLLKALKQIERTQVLKRMSRVLMEVEEQGARP